MTIMCVMRYVCFNWHFTEIKVQRETRSRCKQERNEWSQRLKTDSELFALTSYHHASCLCLMTRARQQSTVPPYRPTSLFILVSLFCSHLLLLVLRTSHFWSMWPDQATEGFIKRQNIQKTFYFFCIEFISVCPHSCTYCGHKSFQGLFALRSCVPLRSGSALFLTSTDNSFPFYPTFRGHSPQHTLISLPTHPSLVELSPFCTRSVPIKADSPSAACPANTSQR